MPLNTSTWTWKLDEPGKFWEQVKAYVRSNPNFKYPEYVERKYREDLDEYLAASTKERREDWTGRPTRLNIFNDYLYNRRNNLDDPEVGQILKQLPDLGLQIGQKMKLQHYHGPTSFLGKLGQAVGMAGMAAGIGMGISGLAGAVTAPTTVAAEAPGLLGMEPMYANMGASLAPAELLGGSSLTPISLSAGAGAGAAGLLGLDAIPQSAIAQTLTPAEVLGGSTLTPANLSPGLLGIEAIPQTSIAETLSPAEVLGGGTTTPANNGGILATNLSGTPGIGEASASMIDAVPLGNGATVGSAVGEMAGTFPAVPIAGGTTAGISGTIKGLINTAATGNEFGIPGITGQNLSNPVYTSNQSTGLLDKVLSDPNRLLKAGLTAAGLLGGGSPTQSQVPEFNYTPFPTVPIRREGFNKVLPSGGYYQQMANSLL